MTIDEFEAATSALTDALAHASALEAAAPLMLTSERNTIGRQQLTARSELGRCVSQLRGALAGAPARSGREGSAERRPSGMGNSTS